MKGKATIKTLATIIVVAGCLYMVLNNLLHPMTFVPMVAVRLPMLNCPHKDIVREHFDDVRGLKVHSPKMDFMTESTDRQKDCKMISFEGK